MHRHLFTGLFASLTFCTAAFAGDNDKKTIVPAPPEEDRWKFLLAAPGFMAGVEGTVGLNGVNSDIDLGFDTILKKIDMVWATRAEASKGRFGVMGELIYLSMSDGAGTDTVIQKVDVRVDEYLADFTLRYRLIEGPKGFVDVLAGVRYTNIYQAVSLRPNDQAIGEFAEKFTDDISARLRERVEQTLSEGRFRNALKAAVSKRVTSELASFTGPESSGRSVPNAPLAHRTPGLIIEEIERLVERRGNTLVAETSADVQAAVAADKAAAKQAIDVERAKLRAKAAELRARVDRRIARAQSNLENDIKKVLHKKLNQNVARTDDWWDPYVGLRARYNFTPAIYVIGRGDIGGFGVGSELMWQAEAALGVQLSRSIYTELGYRALSFNYDKDGFLDDTITHGAQLTLGVTF